MFKTAPLSSSFALVAILGFLITFIYTIYGRINATWGFAVGLVFILMFVASMVSAFHAPIEQQEEADHILFAREQKAEDKLVRTPKPKSK
ncbi:hypothetical protein HON01_05635 [Candidatus Woesearchaeota archaeon]|jgi:hypothetical protein|nr:hypothetical protein [Candidatus Woesearchaeota archaeon]MBT7366596.1 hypothetical protein [Candidatus Woesearchaeota archaeon]